MDEDEYIIVDTREPDDFLNLVRGYCDDPVYSRKLDVGDVTKFKDGRRIMTIERKDISDFYSSVTQSKRKTGNNKGLPRFFAQMNELMDYYPAYLFVTRDVDDIKYTMEQINVNFNPNELYGAIASALTRYQIPVVWSASKEQAARITAYMSKKHSEDKVLRMMRSKPKKDIEAVDMLEQFTSRKVAENLVDEFGSISSICEASLEELKDVKGVGTVTANVIMSKLHGE